MKLRFVILLFICCKIQAFAQKEHVILFTIDDASILVSEFKSVFEKNLELLPGKEQKDVAGYLDLYINYKLKVLEGYHLRIDTSRTYKRDIETYRNQLIAPYLQDSVIINKLVKGPYYKTMQDMKMSRSSVFQLLKEKYKIVIHQHAKAIFEKPAIRGAKRETLQKVVLVINDKKIKQYDFFDYIRNRRHKKTALLFQEFLDQEILAYYKENLKQTDAGYASTLKEYEEGLLIFELMEQKIWKVSSKDSIGLRTYFKNHLEKYSFDNLEENKGTVMNDYQLFLEGNWMKRLKKKHKVTIRKKALKALVTYYSSL